MNLKKEARRQKSALSRARGEFGEYGYSELERLRGKKVKRTGRGSDFRVGSRLKEVKSGKYARPTKLQKKLIKKGKVDLVRTNW